MLQMPPGSYAYAYRLIWQAIRRREAANMLFLPYNNKGDRGVVTCISV